MDPLMDRVVLRQYLAVDHQRGHLVLRIDLQVLGREILPLAVIERPDLEIGARFGQCDIGSERASVGCVVESNFHLRLLVTIIDQRLIANLVPASGKCNTLKSESGSNGSIPSRRSIPDRFRLESKA